MVLVQRSTLWVGGVSGSSRWCRGRTSRKSTQPVKKKGWFDNLDHANQIFCLSVITLSFFEYSIIWLFRPCNIYFLKAHHAGKQYRPVLTQYHRVPTSTALYWPSIQWFDGLDHVNQIFSESISHWQPVPPCFDPVSPSTDQYHPILAQYHQVTTSAALYRPSTIKYQSVPPNTVPFPPTTNK